MSIQVNLRQVVFALADALDLVGVDDLHHGKRVGLMAAETARQLGWSTADQQKVFDAGLLHDCGVSSTRVHEKLVREFDWAGSQAHCETGFFLLREFAPLAQFAPLILNHHTRWPVLVAREMDDRIRLMSNLIFLVDRVDSLAAPYFLANNALLHADTVRQRIVAHGGQMFSPELVSAFLEASRRESFWLRLEGRHIETHLRRMDNHQTGRTLNATEFKALATIFARIVDAKTPFTVEHSLGVSRLARHLGERFGLPADTCDKLEIAGLLHDIGKLQVPDQILEDAGALDEQARSVLKTHSFDTSQILQSIDGLAEIADWASFHHESLDGSGYPFRLHGAELSLEARIVHVADIFQAMVQKRPYRDPVAPEKILAHLWDLVARQAVDARVVEKIAEDLDRCVALAGTAGRADAPDASQAAA